MIDLYSLSERLWKNSKLKISILAAFVMSMLAHAYSYYNATFGLDRYYWFGGNSSGYNNKLNMGKWFFRPVKALDWGAYLPWLNGVIAFVCLGVSVYMICEVLDIRNTFSIFLIAGLCAVDGSVIMAHFYDPDSFLIALMLACIALWIWNRPKIGIIWRIVLGVLFISLSIGVYGAYTTIAPTVVIIACIMLVINGEDVTAVFKRGVEFVVTFVLGVGLYYLIQRVLLRITGTVMTSYLNEDRLMTGASFQEILGFIREGYMTALKWWLRGRGVGWHAVSGRMATALFICFVLLLAIMIYQSADMKKSVKAYVLMAFLLVVLPLSAGAIYVMAFGMVHGLMTFTFVALYIAIIRLCEEAWSLRSGSSGKVVKYAGTIVAAVSSVMIIFCIYRGVLAANMSYSRWDNLNAVSDSIAFRVLERIESCDDFQGNEDVVFVGDVTDSEYFGHSGYENSDTLKILNGMLGVDSDASDTFLYYSHLIWFLQEYTETDLNMYYFDADDFDESEHMIINNMPLFPADGSVYKLNGRIVVKFSN